MRVPLSWLREYVEVDLDVDDLAERLTLLGMEVKGIEKRGSDWRGVVVGELLAVEPHPGSDHLSLTSVRVADGEPLLSIVCGATNIVTGQRVPVALPGAILPGERRIEVTRIAGRESQGMLCSGDELRLTTDAEGILILPPDTPLGIPLDQLFGDVILDVDVKPNRGDALSIIGLAREVAATTRGRVRWPEIAVAESGSNVAEHLSVDVLEPMLCPRFVGRWADGVTVGPSPLPVQARLMAAGVRPISNVVDASNYVMLELGKPTHTFDGASVSEGRIVVRRAVDGERLETLDHVDRHLTPDTLVIADPRGPIGIAGIMGGAASEVTEATRVVAIESAVFDPTQIRRTAQRYGLRSEASLRFEKGQESRLARLGADRVAQLLLAWSGGRVAVGAVDTNPRDPPPGRLPFRPGRIRRLLGVDIPTAEMRDLLERVEVATEPAAPGDRVPVVKGEEPVGLEPADVAAALVAIVPSHRRDLEIEADVAEEIARVRGYETIPGTLPHTAMPDYRPDPLRVVDELRESLAGRGLSEVVTHALVGPTDHQRLGIRADDPATIRVTNPLSGEHSQLRRSLLPGLVAVLVENERQRRPDVAVFEVGSVHRLVEGRPAETRVLGILLAGDFVGGSWNQVGREADLWDALGVVDWLSRRIGLPPPIPSPAEPLAGLEHPGRAVDLAVAVEANSTAELGRVVELDPRYVEALGSRARRVAVATLHLDVLETGAVVHRRYRPFTRVPAMERDLAIVVPEARPAGDVETVIRASAGALLRDLRLFDVYRGAPLAEGERSLAYRLTLQASSRTLTDEEVDEAIATIVAALDRRLGARIRA